MFDMCHACPHRYQHSALLLPLSLCCPQALLGSAALRSYQCRVHPESRPSIASILKRAAASRSSCVLPADIFITCYACRHHYHQCSILLRSDTMTAASAILTYCFLPLLVPADV